MTENQTLDIAVSPPYFPAHDAAAPQIATPVAEPPVTVNFVFLGKTLRAKPVTDGQIVAIAMAKTDGQNVLATTVLKIVKSRVGSANWSWMHDQLTEGNAEFTDVAEVFNQLAEARKTVADIADGA